MIASSYACSCPQDFHEISVIFGLSQFVLACTRVKRSFLYLTVYDKKRNLELLKVKMSKSSIRRHSMSLPQLLPSALAFDHHHFIVCTSFHASFFQRNLLIPRRFHPTTHRWTTPRPRTTPWDPSASLSALMATCLAKPASRGTTRLTVPAG